MATIGIRRAGHGQATGRHHVGTSRSEGRPWGRLSAVLALTSLVLTGCVAATPPPAPTTGWSIAASYSEEVSSISGISCPTSTNCMAVGDYMNGTPYIITSSDGGLLWSLMPAPAEAGPLEVACTSVADCVIVGQYAAVTTDGGMSWNTSTIPGSPILDAVACPTAATCIAVGYGLNSVGEVVTSTDGGATWSSQALPSGAPSLSSITCPTTTECFAAGSGASAGAVIATTNGGATWSSQALPSGVTGLVSITCPTATECFAAGKTATGGTVITTTNGGATWSSVPLPSSYVAYSIGCSTASTCIALMYASSGATAFVTTDAGGTWSTSRLQNTTPTGIACVSAKTCIVTGADAQPMLQESTDGGLTWQGSAAPGGAGPDMIDHIACPSPSQCMAVGDISSTTTTTDAGLTWSTQELAAGAVDVSCPSVNRCVLAGWAPSAAQFSTDGGTTWSTGTVPSDVELMNSVSCPSPTVCFAAASNNAGTTDVLSSSDEGSTWSTVATLGAVGTSQVIGCPTTTSCVLAGNTSNGTSVIEVTTDGGTSWTTASLPVSPPYYGGFHRITCTAPTTCFAFNSGATLEANGSLTSWQPLSLPSGFNSSSGIACTSTNDCFLLAAGSSGSAILATTDGGSTWTNDPIPAGIGSLDDIACPSPSACYAVGSGEGSTGGEILTFRTGAQVIITSTSLPNAFVGSPYSATLAATFDAAPYAWAITSGTLPTGLTLDASTGVISGTPATGATTSAIIVQVTGAAGSTAAENLTITVS